MSLPQIDFNCFRLVIHDVLISFIKWEVFIDITGTKVIICLCRASSEGGNNLWRLTRPRTTHVLQYGSAVDVLV